MNGLRKGILVLPETGLDQFLNDIVDTDTATAALVVFYLFLVRVIGCPVIFQCVRMMWIP